MSRENVCRYCQEAFPGTIAFVQHQCPRRHAKAYLGDGAYCTFDGIHLVVTTEDGGPCPTNTVFMDLAVFRSLCEQAEKHWRISVALGKGRP